jgi:multidrug efflux pump subunit AcrB
MISHFFIERPIFASVLSIVILLVGGISLIALPVARYPEIAPPTIVVEATYPGATAETIAETVATPIEQEVNGVEGMIYMSSTSSSDGTMQLSVTFEQGVGSRHCQCAGAKPALPWPSPNCPRKFAAWASALQSDRVTSWS